MKKPSKKNGTLDNPAFSDENGNGRHENGGTPAKYQDKVNGEVKKEEDDPWTVDTLEQDYVPWNDLTGRQKVKRAVMYPVHIIAVLALLYLFICSLDFLSSSFKLVGGKKAGEVFRQSHILSNPVAGLMMGVLVTVLVQSSSTSTSIIISMVGAGILQAESAVFIVMGANIGTSVTNTIVALSQIASKADFRRAFAGATVHDMFNWMAVLILLPLEVLSGYLFRMSRAIVDSMHLGEKLDLNQDFLKTITKPFTTKIIQVSSSGIKKIATGVSNSSSTSLMKFCCDKVKPESCCKKELTQLASNLSVYGMPQTLLDSQRSAVCHAVDSCVMKDYSADGQQDSLAACMSTPWSKDKVTAIYDNLSTLQCTKLPGNNTEMACCNNLLEGSSMFKDMTKDFDLPAKESLCSTINSTCYSNDVYSTCMTSWVSRRVQTGLGDVFSCKNWTSSVERTCNKPCKFLFRGAHEQQGGPLSDEALGFVLLAISLFLLCVCLFLIVKILQTLLRGPLAKLIKKFVNADFPGYCGYFTGYLAILIGAGMTILVQSSSIFTSTLTPLVGIGVINLDRMYPLTLGSNIGTTATGVLAALAQDVDAIPRSLQVAFCHLFFNISGIIIFYPFPFFRPPIPAAKFLGNTTAKYRWFAIVYLIFMFFIAPAAVFGLSMLGWYVLAGVLIPMAVVVISVGIIKCLQAKIPGCLPHKLRNWKFLPLALRSLEPYDRVMKKVCCCKRFQNKEDKKNDDKNGSVTVQVNGGFDDSDLTTKL